MTEEPSNDRRPRRVIQLNWPMGLTILRLLLLPMFIWILLIAAADRAVVSRENNHLRWLAISVFVLMAITDKLDGYLARRLHQSTQLGAILDPLADKLLIGISLILLSFPWIAPPGYEVPVQIVWAVYGKDLGISLGAMIFIAAAGRLEVSSRFLGQFSTVMQLALVFFTLVSADMARVSPTFTGWFLYFMWWGVFLSALIASLDYIAEGSRQYGQHRRRMVELAA